MQTYISRRIERVYTDRRKAHCFKFILRIYNKIQYSRKIEIKLDISTIYQRLYYNVLQQYTRSYDKNPFLFALEDDRRYSYLLTRGREASTRRLNNISIGLSIRCKKDVGIIEEI